MDCETVERIVSKHLDGEATAEELLALDEHCASCAACRGYRVRLSAQHEVLDRGLGGVLAALRPRAPRPRLWRRVARIAAVLALMIGSGLVGYVVPRRAELAGPEVERRVPAVKKPAGPSIMVGETEREAVRHVMWDPDAGLRTASRIDRDRMYRIADPNGDFEIKLRTTDSLYRLVGLGQ